MTLATQTLEKLSQDPDVRRRARYREDELKLYQIELAAARAAARTEGRVEGRIEGRVEGEVSGKAGLLLKLLGLRFGPVSDQIHRRVYCGTPEQLDSWAERVLGAVTLDEVFE